MLCVEEDPQGNVRTDFSHECFREAVKTLLNLIPLGRVVSYSHLAKILKSHPRSVANALRRNEEPILIPCHRVVHDDGRAGGYTLNGKPNPEFKKKLLLLEGVTLTDGKIGEQHFIKLFR